MRAAVDDDDGSMRREKRWDDLSMACGWRGYDTPGEMSMCYEEEHCIEMGNILR